jgi:hypothetical protein
MLNDQAYPFILAFTVDFSKVPDTSWKFFIWFITEALFCSSDAARLSFLASYVKIIHTLNFKQFPSFEQWKDIKNHLWVV